jgi:hypothetical protein
VELVQADRVDAEALERRVARLLEVLRPAVEAPALVRLAGVAALGGDQDVGRVAAEARDRARDERLVVPEVGVVPGVGVGGVDQRDAGLQRRVDGGDRLLLVRPARERHRHTAEADGTDLRVANAARLHRVFLPCGCSATSFARSD